MGTAIAMRRDYSSRELRRLATRVKEAAQARIHRRIDLFAGVGAGCTSEERQYGELKNRHTYSRIVRGFAITITLRRPHRNDPTGGLLTAPSAQGAVREPLNDRRHLRRAAARRLARD